MHWTARGLRDPKLTEDALDFVRLLMAAPVERIAVFGGTCRTERKIDHGSAFAIIWQPVDDGEARPAVRAIDEGIPVAAVRRVEELGDAGLAGGRVGADVGAPGGLRIAGSDDESLSRLMFQGEIGVGHADHGGHRRKPLLDPGEKGLDGLGWTLHFDGHPVGAVPDKTG